MPLQILSPLHKASRQIGIHLQPTMERLGLAGTEAHLLSFLASYAPCATGELVRVFGLKPSTVTSMLDRLEGLGFLARSPSEEDGRSIEIALTPKGKRVATSVNEIVLAFERDVLERVNAQELAGFRAVMEAVAAATGVEVRSTKGWKR